MRTTLYLVALSFPTLVLAAAITQTKVFAPFSPEGLLNKTLQINKTIEGYCWTQSLATSRPDAWRCMSGNSIYDPCFVNSEAKQAVCTSTPWNNTVILINLTKPLPTSTNKPIEFSLKNPPWVIELDNGQHCVFITGATTAIAGMRLNYGCENGNNLIGDIDRTEPIWRIFYQANNGYLEQVPINAAWY